MSKLIRRRRGGRPATVTTSIAAPPAAATAYTTALSAASGTTGSGVTMTFTPTGGVWPTSEVITPTVSGGVAGVFSPTTVSATGSGSVYATWTPSAVGTAHLSSTTSPSMTNTTGALDYVVSSGAGSGGGGAPLSDIIINQPQALPSYNVASVYNDNRAVVATFSPVGGSGPFKYHVIYNGQELDYGYTLGGYDHIGRLGIYEDPQYGTNYVIISYYAADYTDAPITLKIVDATGATVTKSWTPNLTATGPVIFLDATRTWPSNDRRIWSSNFYRIYNGSTGSVADASQVQLTDASGLWTATGQNVVPISYSIIPPVGTYPMTLTDHGSSGAPPLNFTMTIAQATMGSVQFTQQASVLTTAAPAGWVVAKATCTTPLNSVDFSIAPNGGKYRIDRVTGVITVVDTGVLTAGTDSVAVTATENGLTSTNTLSITVTPGTLLPATNMTMTVNSSLLNDAVGQTIGTPSVTGVTGTKTWSLLDHTLRNDNAERNGTPNRFLTDPTTGTTTAPYWLSAGLDGVSAATYDLKLCCTDGTHTCVQTFTCSVAWAPVSQTFYIGRGMAAAHGAGIGYDHISDFRLDHNSFNAPHAGTYHVLLYADADPEYYTNDCQEAYAKPAPPFAGPIIIEGVANAGVTQPRTGGPTSNNQQGGFDSNPKGFWVFGNGDGVFKNIEVSCVHGYTFSVGPEAMRKDGGTYGNLSIFNCYIHDCDQGIQSGNYVQGSMLIDHVEIANCGTAINGSGNVHNIYVGSISQAIIRNITSRRSMSGHTCKVRAMISSIHDCQFYDSCGGSASQIVNIPDGGVCEIYNCYIQKGPMAQNPDAIRLLDDGMDRVWEHNAFNIHDNQIFVMELDGNHFGTPTAIGHFPTENTYGVLSSCTIANNQMWLAPAAFKWRNYDHAPSPTDAYPTATIETGTTILPLPLPPSTTRPYLSGSLPVAGPLFRNFEWQNDNYANWNDAGQSQDRDWITVSHTAGTGTVLCTMKASNDLADQGAGTANPWSNGTTWQIITDGVYYPYQNPSPWAPAGRYGVTSNADGSCTLKVTGSLSTLASTVDFVQLQATAPNGARSWQRYPIVIT